MTAEEFRQLALELPGAIESSHMGHPDFRVGGKIFATLLPDDRWAMVKLTRDEQEMFVSAAPEVFSPIPGKWGLGGATRVHLKKATKANARDGLLAAWRGRAPKAMVRELDREQ